MAKVSVEDYLLPGEVPFYIHPWAVAHGASKHINLLGGNAANKIDVSERASGGGTLVITDRRLFFMNSHQDKGTFAGRNIPSSEFFIDQALAVKEIEARRPFLHGVEETGSFRMGFNKEFVRLRHIRLLTGAAPLDSERGRLMGFSLGAVQTGVWFSTQESLIWTGAREPKKEGVMSRVMRAGYGVSEHQYALAFKADYSQYTGVVAYLVARLAVGPNMAAAVWEYAADADAKPPAPPPPPPPTPPPVSASPPTAGERFCTSCGAGNARSSAFCNRCGKPLPPPP